MKKEFGWVVDPQIVSCKKFIAGSDQIWTFLKPDYTLRRFPSSVCKLSYAASADWDFIKNQPGTLYSLTDALQDFKAISVREEIGKKLVSSLVPSKEIFVTLDPALLLSSKDYLHLVDDNIYFQQPTLFAYFVNITAPEQLYIDLLEVIARKNKLKIAIGGIQGAEEFIPKKYYIPLPPENFIKAFHEAKMVVTNSFHGTLFSLVFHHRFATIEQVEKPGRNQNRRLHELLEKFDLGNRCLSIDKLSYLESLLAEEINWNIFDLKLEKFKEFSLKWLKENLGN